MPKLQQIAEQLAAERKERNQLVRALRKVIAKWRRSASEPWDAGYVHSWLRVGYADEISSVLAKHK